MINLKFPCSQRPDSMSIVDGQHFCEGCSKSIVDFRGKSIEEIQTIKNSTKGELCGIFDSLMVQSKIEKSFARFRMAFVMVFFLGLTASTVFGQSASTQVNAEPEVVAVSNSVKIKGQVIDKEIGEPLPFVKVYIEQDGVSAFGVTDFEGNYVFNPPVELIGREVDVHFRFIGYEEQIVKFKVLEAGEHVVNVELDGAQQMLGIVVGFPMNDGLHPPSDPWDFNRTSIKGEDLRNY